ncbi:MAG: hypothetical protein J7619_12000, partial [Dyadobacter sp.]|uniref:hypothetical protein n=1 Tax=Dyadobacter sp. TaxID=1914288 RepID=UPI001B0E4559
TDGSGGKGWYALPSGGGVPTSRVLTINGISQDLSLDRSWTISAGVSGSGSSNYIPMWNGSTSLTNSLLQYVGGVLIRMNGNFEVDGLTFFKRVTASERLSMSISLGGQVYQTDGTEGVYVYKSTGWVYVG